MDEMLPQLSKIKNENAQNVLVNFYFKRRGKFFIEATKPQIESLKNQIGASKWFIWLYILRVLIAYDVLYFVKGPSHYTKVSCLFIKHLLTCGFVTVDGTEKLC